MNNRKRILWSAVIGLGFLALFYFIGNIPFSIKGEKMMLKWVEFVKEDVLKVNENKYIDTLLFVNVNYDKEMRPVCKDGIPLGRLPITDRQKLLSMLQYLKQKDDYKYILLDVRFGDDVKTQWDSALFATIESMSRIIIPYHSDMKLADVQLKEKAGLADYYESFWVYGFTKYPYYKKNEKTLPVKMYEDVTGRSFKKWGPFYLDGWRLANGCEFLSLDIKANSDLYDNGKLVWYNLGTHLLKDSIPELKYKGQSSLFESTELTKGKYIVIGSYDGDDMVSTFKGCLSGAVIQYDAFCSLKKGRHKVSYGFSLFWFILFFFLSFRILNEENKQKKLDRFIGEKRLVWRITLFLLLPLITYNLILQFCCIVIYLVFDKVFEVLLISTIFYYFSLIVKLKNQIQIWQKKK